MSATRPIFIMDANVLIDYANADPAMLPLMARHIGPIHMPRRIFQEVPQWGGPEGKALDLLVVTEDIAEIQAAMTAQPGLSFADRLVLAIAQRRSWTAITNDGRLRKTLAARRVGMRWGMEMMLDVVRSGHLTPTQAVAVAERICSSNPRIKPSVLADFRKKATLNKT